MAVPDRSAVGQRHGVRHLTGRPARRRAGACVRDVQELLLSSERTVDGVARCATARCAWRWLRQNRFDPVDGIVPSGTGRRLELRMATDHFPGAWRLTPVVFDTRRFDAPYFSVRRLSGV